MDFWKQNITDMKVDSDPAYTAMCIEPRDTHISNIPCTDHNGIPILKESVFGGIACEKR